MLPSNIGAQQNNLDLIVIRIKSALKINTCSAYLNQMEFSEAYATKDKKGFKGLNTNQNSLKKYYRKTEITHLVRVRMRRPIHIRVRIRG